MKFFLVTLETKESIFHRLGNSLLRCGSIKLGQLYLMDQLVIMVIGEYSYSRVFSRSQTVSFSNEHNIGLFVV